MAIVLPMSKSWTVHGPLDPITSLPSSIRTVICAPGIQTILRTIVTSTEPFSPGCMILIWTYEVFAHEGAGLSDDHPFAVHPFAA